MNSILQLARERAKATQQRFPHCFQTLPVNVEDLAREMGLDVMSGASSETFYTQHAGLRKIEVDGRKTSIGKRLSIAHEIGHDVLETDYPILARGWSSTAKERFAKYFGREILIPNSYRRGTRRKFRDSRTPLELRTLAATFGIYPSTMLVFASMQEQWTKDLNRIWIIALPLENRVTRLDRKLRIVSACYDRTRFFLPTNQGLERFLLQPPPDYSLEFGCPLVLLGTDIRIKEVRVNCQPKFAWIVQQADVSIVRFEGSQSRRQPYLVVAATIDARDCLQSE